MEFDMMRPLEPVHHGHAIFMLAMVTFVAYSIYWYKKTYSFWSSRGIPGPTPLPFFGNTLTYIFNSVPEIDIKNSKIYGRMYGVYDGTNPVLILSEPRIIEKVLISEYRSFNLHDNNVSDDPMVMNTILMKHGDDAKRIRAVFTSNMRQSKLKAYIDLIKTDDLMSYLKNVQGSKININDVISLYLLNILIQIFYGLDLELFKYSSHEVIRHTRHWFDYMNVLPSFLSARLPSFLFKFYPDKAASASTYLRELVNFAMNERVKKCCDKKDNEDIRNDFLQQFLDSNLTDIEKESNALAALGAAFDTTSSVFSFMFYELGRNNHCMEQLRDEIDKLYREKLNQNDEVDRNTLEDLQSLTYLEQCLNETLRMHPVVIRSFRGSADVTTIPTTDIAIPPNTVINTAVYALHYDEGLFEAPNVFDPSRWSEERKKEMTNCSSFLFGAGPRKCPGGKLAVMIVKIALIDILRLYDVNVCDESDVRTPPGFLTTQPRNIWINFIPRIEK